MASGWLANLEVAQIEDSGEQKHSEIIVPGVGASLEVNVGLNQHGLPLLL